MITENCVSYMNAPSQQAKKDTCDHIVKMVRGRFLRLDVDRSCWIEIDDETARTKVAQAFQYRQRRQTPKEPPGCSNHDTYKKDRKRKLSVASFLPDHCNPATYHHNMRIPQTSDFENTAVSLDELRWVLGSQSSLPQQQQQHWQQQQQQVFLHSNSEGTTFSGDNPTYSEEYAIGMPATMRSRQNEQIQQLTQPLNQINEYVERMRHSAVSQNVPQTHPGTNASFQMQPRFNQQANVMQMPEQSRTASSMQLFQPLQPSQAQYHHLNWHPNQPDFDALGNPTTDSTGLTLPSSQSMDPTSLQQSIYTQDGGIPSHAIVDYDTGNFGNVTTASDTAYLPVPNTSFFDFSCYMAPSGIFQREITDNSYESANAETQRRKMFPPVDHNVHPVQQQPFLMDPLPLDENEIAQSYDKVMERMERNSGDIP